MARISLEDKLAKLNKERLNLIEKQATIKAKELLAGSRLDARKNEQARKDDTRRKVLLGAFILSALEKEKVAGGPAPTRTWLKSDLSGFLKNDRDKKLLADFL